MLGWRMQQWRCSKPVDERVSRLQLFQLKAPVATFPTQLGELFLGCSNLLHQPLDFDFVSRYIGERIRANDSHFLRRRRVSA